MSRYRTPVSVAVSAALAHAALLNPQPALADPADSSLAEVTVTATRREESIQNVPLNITAIGGSELENRGVSGLADLGREIPGLYVIDQGGRNANRIVVRGLNATSVGSSEGVENDGGGTVATYIGEIPLYVDLKPLDIDRVEVLLGPQGTLYGAGTLGGAIRYLPARPSFTATSLTLRGDTYGLSEASSVGAKGGLTLNVPLSDTLAFRTSVEYLDDPGFIDYDYLVRDPGLSDPQPDPNDPTAVAANLKRKKDANDEESLYGRAALRWKPFDALDATLTYFYQDQNVGARTVSHQQSFGTGPYVSAERYLEPNDRKNQLAALEITADLGFAELTSATGASRFREHGQRDQTDLLITLEYGYEAFPTFSAFTREDQTDKTYNQEFRLVSKTPGPLSWIAGAFYNKLKRDSSSKEFTPHYSEYLVSVGVGDQVRPDELEYYNVDKKDQREEAVYGELTYNITDKWEVTGGARWYDYKLDTQSAVDIPMFSTVLGERGPNDIVLNFQPGGQKDHGSLFKFNTAYHFTPELMGYATLSEGYRIGDSNGVALCPNPLPPGQIVCATPAEFQFFPDRTKNYELGFRSQWLDRRVTVNGAGYYIKWQDPQLTSATVAGAQPITLNGKGAKSTGFELSLSTQITEHFGLDASVAYTHAELTKGAPSLLQAIDPPGFGTVFVDAAAGDRLPGSPERQGTIFANYAMPLSNGWKMDFNYGIAALGDIYSRTGLLADGEKLPGYAVHQAWVTLKSDKWSASLYANNLWNKFAVTGVRTTPQYIQTVTDENGAPVPVRDYYHDVLRPRQIGVRFAYDFSFR